MSKVEHLRIDLEVLDERPARLAAAFELLMAELGRPEATRRLEVGGTEDLERQATPVRTKRGAGRSEGR